MFSTEKNPGRSSHLQGQKGTNKSQQKGQKWVDPKEEVAGTKKCWGGEQDKLYQG